MKARDETSSDGVQTGDLVHSRCCYQSEGIVKERYRPASDGLLMARLRKCRLQIDQNQERYHYLVTLVLSRAVESSDRC